MMKFILPVLFSLSCFVASSQKYAFVPLSTEQGLPQTQVTSICQDNKNYLWISTLGGLAQFNGGDFKTYSSGDGLFNNRITKLSYFDSTLFVGHDGGLTIFKNEQFTIIPYPKGEESHNVSDILEFNGRILISSNGGGLFELKNKEIFKLQTEDSSLEGIRDMEVFDGILYFATKNGIYTTKDVKKFSLCILPEVSYRSIVSDNNSVFFVGLSQGIFQLKNGEFSQVLSEYPVKRISGAYLDQSGKIWMNSSQGVITWSLVGGVQLISEETGLPINMVSCFFEDKDQNIWMGSSGKGLFRFPGKMFQYFDESIGLSSSLFVSGFQDDSGKYFLGSYNNGLLTTDLKGNSIPVGEIKDPIWAMVENVDDKHWFGAQTSMFSLDKEGNIEYFDEAQGIPGLKVTSFFKISSNEMFIGGSEGVSHYKSGDIWKVSSDQDLGTVRDFALVGGKLVCASNLGLFVLERDRFVPYLGVDNVAYNLEVDNQNNLWFGTEEGLFRVRKGKIERIDLLEIPSANYINFINFRDDRMFVGTNYGLFVLSDLYYDEPRSIRFGIAEGIVDLETNLNSGFFGKSDDFWFGTASGLVRLSLSEMSKLNVKPRIHLIDVLVNNSSVKHKKEGGAWFGSSSEDVQLKHTDNNLIFELDGISMSHHRNLNYQFFLQGLNSEWSPPSRSSVFTFTNLSSGDYNLKMRAIDIDGSKSEIIEIPFEILSPIYMQWWFILLAILLLGIILLWIFMSRLRQVRVENEKEKLEFKTRLLTLEQQSMNASMNRHFVFNSLNSIQYFINTSDRVSANKYLTDFAKLIRKNLDSATSKGNLVTLEDELERIELYLGLESMRFKGRFTYEIRRENMDTDGIKIPSMLLQPFVENSIIHGILPNENKKGFILVNICLSGNFLEIKIEDDGIGIQNSLRSKSKSDGDHVSKGMEITSKRIELIQKLVNRGISLSGPKQIQDENGLINGTRVLLKIPLDNLEIN